MSELRRHVALTDCIPWIAVGLMVAATASAAPIDPAHKTKHSTPAHPSRAAPDVTATIAKGPKVRSAPETPAAPLADDRTIPPPFTLPAASRARVRACGEQWRDMKIAGTTGEDDWRDFASRCYLGKGPAAAAN